MSDCEQFAHIAHEKWATVSESLRLLRGNERSWAIRSEEMRDVSESLISLTKNEQKILAKKSKILFYYVLLKALKKNRQNERIANSQPWRIVYVQRDQEGVPPSPLALINTTSCGTLNAHKQNQHKIIQ